MRERWLLLFFLLLLMTPPGRTQRKPSPTIGRSSADEKWVEKTLSKMSVREKVGQLLMVYYFGQFTSTESVEYKELLRQVQENHIGGFILGTQRDALGIERAEVYPAAVLANELQVHAKIPLLIGADFERGTAMRIDEGTSFPFAMAVGATGNPQDAYTVGKVTALEARAAGVHWVFAPDSDVNDNPDNPIINIRSFGEDPQRVGEFVSAYVRGVEENGALATAKHFPGHGDVNTDSHIGIATVPGDRQRLESVELVPFRAAIAAGVSSIMTGHLAVPAFEPDPSVPATLSPHILTDLLRKELGFEGLLVTDALDMGGVTNVFPPGEAAVRSIAAGADVLLLSPTPDAAITGLEDAVNSGRLSISRVDDSVRRILRAKSRLGLVKEREVDVGKLNTKFGRPEFSQQAQDIADRGITLLRDQDRVLPLDATKPLRVLLVQLSGDPDPWPGPDFEQEIRQRVDSLTTLRADTQFVKVGTVQLPPPETYDIAIAALYVRVADRKGNVGLPDDQAELMNRLLAAGKPSVIACFGSPYLIERFPAARAWIASFGTPEVSQRAMGRALFGQVAIAGQIPVTVPGVVKRGDGMRVPANPMQLKPAAPQIEARLKPTFDLLDRAVADKAFPGGVLAVGLKDELLVHPFGRFTYDPKSAVVATNTVYDLASLTKPVVTTTTVMLLVEEKRLDLDAPISRYIPEWPLAAKSDPNPDWRARVTVRQMLLHTSGLPAHRDFYKDAKGSRTVLARVVAEPLVSEPGTKVEYSDLGFILLGEIVERITGESLDKIAQEWIFQPLAMKDSTFVPPKSLRAEIAPTEDDTAFRKRLLQGEVDDANAFAMGGVAGHAGLFSTADNLAAFAQMMLNGGIYAHHRLLNRSTIQDFTARQNVGGAARALGWDVPTEPSSTGRYFSARSYGHNGYTGTSLWIDPERDLFVILLANRVYPTAENDKIRQLRPAFHDAILEALGLASGRAANR
ncbi:MAG: glycoside hydrolase family 3 N-terminal domain-containing protein [Candidatus Acidiferrales bacterium]